MTVAVPHVTVGVRVAVAAVMGRRDRHRHLARHHEQLRQEHELLLLLLRLLRRQHGVVGRQAERVHHVHAC